MLFYLLGEEGEKTKSKGRENFWSFTKQQQSIVLEILFASQN